jgi:hypothetical protein
MNDVGVSTRPLSRSGKIGIACAAATCVTLIAVCLFATLPWFRKNQILEACAWGLVMLGSCAGWGYALNVALFPDHRADLGLRLVWGASAIVFVGGLLTTSRLFSSTSGLLVILGGAIGACVAAIRERDAFVRSGRFVLRVARRNGLLVVIGCIVAGLVVLYYFGSVADPTSNPFDDDVAYYPLAQKLLQTGGMVEPFSFRRLSALGGQTLFHALTLIHGGVRNLNLFDHGMCVAMVILLLFFHRENRRRPPLYLTLLAGIFFLTLPNNGINSASHFSGVAFFLGLYRTMVWIDDRPRGAAWRPAVVLGLIAAAVCTLRQNYLVVPIVMVGVSYLYKMSSEARPWRARLTEPLLAGVAFFGAILPWLFSAWQSSRSFLFPLQLGTYSEALKLQSETLTTFQKVRFIVGVCVENEPIRTLPLFFVVGALIYEVRGRKPLRAFWIASFIGTVVLAYSFTQSDAGNLARYLYGILTAFALAVVLAVGTQRRRPRLLAALVVIAIGAQMAITRDRLARGMEMAGRYVDEAVRRAPKSELSLPQEVHVYAGLQEVIPRGARVAVLVDEPYYMNFARNEVFNLDMPGYASLPPGLPYFQGSEAVAQYFLGQKIRYLVFVRSAFSRFHYQREFWVQRLFAEEEIWRVVSPYFLDMIDTLATLSKTRTVLREDRGIVVLDLEQRAP